MKAAAAAAAIAGATAATVAAAAAAAAVAGVPGPTRLPGPRTRCFGRPTTDRRRGFKGILGTDEGGKAHAL